MDVAFLVGRVLFAALFLGSGVAHLTQADAMGGNAASRGVPAAKAMTLASGILIIVGGVMVLLGVWGDLGSLLLLAFLVPTAVVMHGFWKETDPQAKQMEMISFNKDMALAGGALAFFWAFSAGVDLTITGPLL